MQTLSLFRYGLVLVFAFTVGLVGTLVAGHAVARERLREVRQPAAESPATERSSEQPAGTPKQARPRRSGTVEC